MKYRFNVHTSCFAKDKVVLEKLVTRQTHCPYTCSSDDYQVWELAEVTDIPEAMKFFEKGGVNVS